MLAALVWTPPSLRVVRGVQLGTSCSPLPSMFHFPLSDLNHKRSSSLQLLLWGHCPEMKEEPRTGLALFKFFFVGFGEGGHINFIGVGQDLGLNCRFAYFWLYVWFILSLPMEYVAVCGREGRSLDGCHRIWGQGLCQQFIPSWELGKVAGLMSSIN